MSKPHELLIRRPFDLYQLHLFRLVAECGSFTRAAQTTGLTQSAITRQIQGVERQLGFSLLKRTTRSVALTTAGAFLLRESAPILGDVDSLLRRINEDYAAAPREVRVGVSRSVSLAYLPGFFSANVRHGSSVISRVQHESSQTILNSLESDELDVGVLLPPTRLSRRLRITHRFRDAFTFIANEQRLAASPVKVKKPSDLRRWMEAQPWLALQDATQTGRRMTAWLKQQGLRLAPAMELDNFDLIINLVVVVRRQRQTPAHIQNFVENILF